MSWRILQGDCLDVLRTLPDESVQCCVTSPPYWGLRDYGTARWEGGDVDCDHRMSGERRQLPHGDGRENDCYASERVLIPGAGAAYKELCGKCGAVRVDQQLGLEKTPELYVAKMVEIFREVRRVLRSDGTLFLNLGDSYFGSWGAQSRDDDDPLAVREGGNSRRVTNGAHPTLKPKDLCGIPWSVAFALRADGWYLRSDIIWSKPNPMPESVTDRPTKAHEYLFLLSKGQWKTSVIQLSNLRGEYFHLLKDFGLRPTKAALADSPSGTDHPALIELCVRLATAIFNAAQVQQDFRLPPFYAEVWQQGLGDGHGDLVGGLPVHHRAAIWAARFLNANASTKEFLSELNSLGIALTNGNNFLVGGLSVEFPDSPTLHPYGETAIAIHHAGQVCKFDFRHNQIIVATPSTCNYFYDAEAIKEASVYPDDDRKARASDDQKRYPDDVCAGIREGSAVYPTRNKRTVWEIATSPFPEAHFATFPPKLVEPCILAGTSEQGCCTECGAPWERIVESSRVFDHLTTDPGKTMDGPYANQADIRNGVYAETRTLGWRPTCQHASGGEPCTILDPFSGAGTTGLVATRLHRSFLGIELNPQYIQMSNRRITDDAPLFNTATHGAGMRE